MTQAIAERWRRIAADETVACTAREIAAYVAARRSLPDESLGAWIAAQCGRASDSTSYAWYLYGRGRLDPERLNKSRLAELLASTASHVPAATRFGVGAATLRRTGIVVIVFAHPLATLSKHYADANGVVRVAGRFLRLPERARAVVNQGRYGFASCWPAPLDLPDFAFDCKLADGDAEAWVDVVVEWDGRPLETQALSALAQRKSAPHAEYERPYVTVPFQRDRGKALLEALNAMRREEGLPELGYLEAQSRAIQALMPEVFYWSSSASDQSHSDHLFGELNLGRQVGAAIQWGNSVAGVAVDGNAGDWLAMRLRSPNAREHLFSPYATHAAAAASSAQDVGYAGAITVFALFKEPIVPAWSDALFEYVAGKREKHGGRTTRLDLPPEFRDMANDITRGRATPTTALRIALVKANAQDDSYYDAVIVDLSENPRDPELPLQLLAPKELSCAVLVTHWKKPDEPWARATGIVVFASTPPEPAQ